LVSIERQRSKVDDFDILQYIGDFNDIQDGASLRRLCFNATIHFVYF
jgi:hypothetical protein